MPAGSTRQYCALLVQVRADCTPSVSLRCCDHRPCMSCTNRYRSLAYLSSPQRSDDIPIQYHDASPHLRRGESNANCARRPAPTGLRFPSSLFAAQDFSFPVFRVRVELVLRVRRGRVSESLAHFPARALRSVCTRSAHAAAHRAFCWRPSTTTNRPLRAVEQPSPPPIPIGSKLAAFLKRLRTCLRKCHFSTPPASMS